MQSKTTMWYHHAPLRMAKIKKYILKKTNAGGDVEKLDLSHVLGGHVKMV